MRWNSRLPAVLIMLLSVTGAGCITADGKSAGYEQSVTTLPNPSGIAARFVARGADLEVRKDPVRALREYRIALSVDPENEEALERARLLETALNDKADEHFLSGLEFHEQGRYEKARREFLRGLRLRPDHHKTVEMLVSRKRVPSTRYVLHAIAPGETLSGLAFRYYEDFGKFPMIAKYNSLGDATFIMAGQVISIPEIEGLPFNTGDVEFRTDEGEASRFGLWEWGAFEAAYYGTEDITSEEAARGLEEEDGIEGYISNGIILFNEKKYRQAIEAFDLALKVKPDDDVALEYAYKARFQLAENLLERKEYLAARDAFLDLLRIREDCGKCNRYILKSEELYLEAHYRKGMQYYNQEKLHEAIGEWERVRNVDPDYKRVDSLIEKAQRILVRLEDLKRGREQKPHF
ncbi:MAG: hypothetical protein ACQET7_08855 [Thermodesulfobacteriota bacterium]